MAVEIHFICDHIIFACDHKTIKLPCKRENCRFSLLTGRLMCDQKDELFA